MYEWYSPNELPQTGVVLLAYYDNTPEIMYMHSDGNWYYAWNKKQANNAPDCWRYLPPRPKTVRVTP